MQFNLLDVIILLILVGSVMAGYKRGFIGAVSGIVSNVAGLVLAVLFRNQAADYLQAQFGMVSDLTAYLEKKISISAGVNETGSWVTNLPIVQNGLTSIHRQIAEFAYLLVAAGCFLVIYILTTMLIGIICMMLERMLPRWFLGSINRPGGVLIILIQNTLIMVALAGILAGPMEMAAQMGIKVAQPIAALMQGSVSLPYLLDAYNWLMVFIGNVF